MITVAAFFSVALVLVLHLTIDAAIPSRIGDSVDEWARAGGYRILQIHPYPKPWGLQFGPSSQAQRFFLVEVLCPDGRQARFILKAGGYFWGGYVKRVKAFSADSAATG